MQEEEENFDIDWLKERYPYDVEARNKELETKVLKELSNKEKVTIVDVGAGTGSNCLYFVEQLNQSQKWYLVEQNELLSNATVRRLREYAAYHKYDYEKKKKGIKITSLTKTIEVILVNDSILNIEKLIDLKKVDLVIANTAFEQFSKQQFDELAQVLIQYKKSFYATLNYQQMAFEPEDPFDDVFINLYNDYKERPQVKGKVMGKNASRLMLDVFESADWKTEEQESTWRVEQNDIKMHYYLLNFMENALAEMKLEENKQHNFAKWVQRKKDLIITRRQQLEIYHTDIFVKP